MGTDFAVGDKVRILEGNILAGKAGVIIKDGGSQNLGYRKPGEAKYNTFIQQWLVKIDDTGDEILFSEGSLRGAFAPSEGRPLFLFISPSPSIRGRG